MLDKAFTSFLLLAWFSLVCRYSHMVEQSNVGGERESYLVPVKAWEISLVRCMCSLRMYDRLSLDIACLMFTPLVPNNTLGGHDARGT